METKMRRTTPRRWGTWAGHAIVALCLAGTLAGCTPTQQMAVEKSSLPTGGLIGDYSKLTAGDQQMLWNVLHQALYEQLEKKYQMVDQPGPGVMRLQVALMDAKAATPVLRTVSMVVPQARALSTLKYVATGTYPF